MSGALFPKWSGLPLEPDVGTRLGGHAVVRTDGALWGERESPFAIDTPGRVRGVDQLEHIGAFGWARALKVLRCTVRPVRRRC
jgi:hypothetical protein